MVSGRSVGGDVRGSVGSGGWWVGAVCGGVLGDGPVRRVGVASAVARLPLGMTTLAVVLMVRAGGGSFTVAGGATACFALASGVTSPLRGRLVDRLGPVRVLAPLGVLQPVALIGVVVFVDAGDAAATVGTAGAAGMLLPPVGPVVRALW